MKARRSIIANDFKEYDSRPAQKDDCGDDDMILDPESPQNLANMDTEGKQFDFNLDLQQN